TRAHRLIRRYEELQFRIRTSQTRQNLAHQQDGYLLLISHRSRLVHHAGHSLNNRLRTRTANSLDGTPSEILTSPSRGVLFSPAARTSSHQSDPNMTTTMDRAKREAASQKRGYLLE